MSETQVFQSIPEFYTRTEMVTDLIIDMALPR